MYNCLGNRIIIIETMSKPFSSLDFHQQIRVKRRELNISQAQLAVKATVSVDTIARLEQGKHLNISLDNLRRISAALNFDEWNLKLLGVQL